MRRASVAAGALLASALAAVPAGAQWQAMPMTPFPTPEQLRPLLQPLPPDPRRLCIPARTRVSDVAAVDGRFVVLQEEDERGYHVVDLAAWRVIGGWTAPQATIGGARRAVLAGGPHSIAISPRGVLAAGAGTDGRAYVWRVRDGHLVAILPHADTAVTRAYAPGRALVLGAAGVWSVHFADRGRELVSVSSRGSVRRWRLRTNAGTPEEWLEPPRADVSLHVQDAVLLAGDTLLVTTQRSGRADGVGGEPPALLHVWDARALAPIDTAVLPVRWGASLRASADGRVLVVGRAPGAKLLWDRPARWFQWEDTVAQAHVEGISADGERYVRRHRRTLAVHDRDDALLREIPLSPLLPTGEVPFTPDGRWVVPVTLYLRQLVAWPVDPRAPRRRGGPVDRPCAAATRPNR